MISIFISCSNNKTDDPVTFHFSKKEMSDLNKTGKVVQTDDKGVERVFIYDDKFSKTSKKKYWPNAKRRSFKRKYRWRSFEMGF